MTVGQPFPRDVALKLFVWKSDPKNPIFPTCFLWYSSLKWSSFAWFGVPWFFNMQRWTHRLLGKTNLWDSPSWKNHGTFRRTHIVGVNRMILQVCLHLFFYEKWCWFTNFCRAQKTEKYNNKHPPLGPSNWLTMSPDKIEKFDALRMLIQAIV